VRTSFLSSPISLGDVPGRQSPWHDLSGVPPRRPPAQRVFHPVPHPGAHTGPHGTADAPSKRGADGAPGGAADRSPDDPALFVRSVGHASHLLLVDSVICALDADATRLLSSSFPHEALDVDGSPAPLRMYLAVWFETRHGGADVLRPAVARYSPTGKLFPRLGDLLIDLLAVRLDLPLRLDAGLA
jgi:hypothetical protein